MNRSFTKLNKKQIKAIRTDPRPQTVIAEDYGVDQSNISKIKNNRIWNTAHKDKICIHCKIVFTPDRNRQYWCSIKCRLFSELDVTDGCWIWRGCTTADGYGQFLYKQKSYRTHRVAYEVLNNTSIPEGFLILHSCDNPPCCNPKHLRVGTDFDNAQDRKKSRSVQCQDL